MSVSMNTLRGIAAKAILVLGLVLGVMVAPTVAPPLAYADASNALSIKAGAAVKTTNNTDGTSTYTFPYLSVQAPNDKIIRGITVQFTSAIESGEDVLLEGATVNIGGQAHTFAILNANKRGNKSANETGQGATAEVWEQYLREHLQLKVRSNSTSLKTLRMIVSTEKVERTLDYNAQNGHYYEYVATKVNWPTARDRAAASTYMGMQGYLVTVTSQAEHDLIYSLVNADTWIGATCHPTFLQAAGIDSTGAYSSTYAKYYWATGPEKGMNFWRGGWGITNANTSANQVDGAFSNWHTREPNNSSGEQCAHLLASAGGRWNDYSYATNCNYVIEYGGLEEDESGSGSGGSGGSGTQEDDTYVKVDISIDTQGKTMHVEAADIVVGAQPNVTATVNGGTVPSVLGDASAALGNGAALLSFRYQRFDEARNAWVDVDAADVSRHAGRYRVQAAAKYNELAADGSWVTDEHGNRFEGDYRLEAGYEDGVEFTVAPKPLDVSVPAGPDASVPPEGTGELAARTYTKTYDGTTAFAASGVSLDDLVVDGAEVHLSFQHASFASADAGVQKLTFSGVALSGADASDYELTSIAPDGSITVYGAILPRNLDIKASFSSDQNWPPDSTWIAGVDMVDPATGDADPHGYFSDVQAFVYDFTGESGDIALGENCPDPMAWPTNMLCPGDTVAEVLGEERFTCQTQDGLTLDRANPQVGVYQLLARFSKVNPVGAGGATLRPDGRYALGNYAVSMIPATLEVTERPEARVVEKTLVLAQTSGQVLDARQIVERVIASGVEGIESLPADDHLDVLIKKGASVVDAIDCGALGHYSATIFVRGDDGFDTLIVVEISVEGSGSSGGVSGSGPDILAPGCFTIATRMAGDVGASTCTSSAVVLGGSNAEVGWTVGADRYVSSVAVDGIERSIADTSVSFANVSADHEVVVTFARIGSIGGSTTYGYYTLTTNRYGEATKVEVSPSAVVRAGQSASATWAPAEGYEVTEVLVDGARLDAQQVQSGSITFDAMDANHVVDVRCAPVGGQCTLAGAEYAVSTRIAGGSGTITGGATVAAGSSYTVAWDVPARAPSGAAYAVSRVEVNGVAVSAAQSGSTALANIRSNQEVVVYVEPVLNHVNIMSIGQGSTSPSKTLYRGQDYSGIIASPADVSRVYRVEIDGAVVYEAEAAHDEQDEIAETLLEEAASELSDQLDDLASDEVNADEGDAASAGVAAGADDEGAAADNEISAGGESSAGTDDAAASNQNDDAARDTVTDAEEADASASENTDAHEAAEALMALQYAHEVPATRSLGSSSGVSSGAESITHSLDQQSGNFLCTISNIAGDHTIKVFFVEQGSTPTPDELRAEQDRYSEVVPVIGGSSGTVAGGGFVEPGTPGPTISWELPNPPKHEVTEVVVNGQRFEISDPDSTSFDIPFGVAPGTRYDVEIVTRPRVPGDDVPAVEASLGSAPVFYQVRTSVVGGPATITPSTSDVAGDACQVAWSVTDNDGSYKVTRVVVDGRSAADKVFDRGEISFADVSADHEVQVVLDSTQSVNAEGGASGAGEVPGEQTPVSQAERSLTGLPQTGDPIATLLFGFVLAGLFGYAAVHLARCRMRNVSRR